MLMEPDLASVAPQEPAPPAQDVTSLVEENRRFQTLVAELLYKNAQLRERLRTNAVADLEAWSAKAQASRSPEQAAAAAKLTDEDVNRLVHESR